MAREILTLQFGHYANFVGTHFWNLQEASFNYATAGSGTHGCDDIERDSEVSHDVLFREGSHAGRVTYTPRLVSMDLHGCLKSLSLSGQLYGDGSSAADAAATWDGDATLHEEQCAAKNAFLQQAFGEAPSTSTDPKLKDVETLENSSEDGATKKWKLESEERARELQLQPLEETVSVWSDFLGTALHPKSLHIIQEYQHNNEVRALDSYFKGRQLLANRDVQEEFEDRIHFFAEECDYLQGFQCLVDCADGFGGAAAGAFDFLSEDYGQKTCLCVPLMPAQLYSSTEPLKVQYNRKLNVLLSLTELHRQCGLLAPMSLAPYPWEAVSSGASQPAYSSWPHLEPRLDLSYHSAAVLASALDAITLPVRCPSSHCALPQLQSFLTRPNQQLLTCGLALPLAINSSGGSLATLLEQQPLHELFTSLSPLALQLSAQPAHLSLTVRGAVHAAPTRQALGDSSPRSYQLRDCRSVRDVLHLYAREGLAGSTTLAFAVDAPLQLRQPFPGFFKRQMATTADGEVCPPFLPDRAATASWVQSGGAESAAGLRSLQRGLPLAQLRGLCAATQDGLELDELTEALEALQCMIERYHEDEAP